MLDMVFNIEYIHLHFISSCSLGRFSNQRPPSGSLHLKSRPQHSKYDKDGWDKGVWLFNDLLISSLLGSRIDPSNHKSLKIIWDLDICGSGGPLTVVCSLHDTVWSDVAGVKELEEKRKDLLWSTHDWNNATLIKKTPIGQATLPIPVTQGFTLSHSTTSIWQ